MTAAAPALPDEDGQNIGYTNRIFVQALFPYRSSEDYRRAITQRNEEIIITSPNGLPYGKYPRLIMAYITTTASIRYLQAKDGLLDENEARRIPLGESMNEFFRRIGTTQRGTGGVRGTITLIREQLIRLASSSIVVQKRIKIGEKEGHRGVNQPIADEWELWFDSSNPDQTTIETSYIQLTKQFFQLVGEHPVPIDLDILQRLNKPRAMDIYMWITMKKFVLTRHHRDSQSITWADIQHQFSPKTLSTSAQRRDFRNEFIKCLDAIRELWPEVDVDTDTAAGVTIHRGAPSVTMRPARPQLP